MIGVEQSKNVARLNFKNSENNKKKLSVTVMKNFHI